MSWQDDAMAEQEAADALEYMGEAEWRDLYGDIAKPKKFHPDHLKRMGVTMIEGKDGHRQDEEDD